MHDDCSFKDESGYSPSIDSSSNPSSSPNPRSSSSSIPNPSIDPSPNPKVITSCFNRCNYVKPLTDFDKSKYKCRNCTSTKVSCLYCPSIVRNDGMNAHVKDNIQMWIYLKDLIKICEAVTLI